MKMVNIRKIIQWRVNDILKKTTLRRDIDKNQYLIYLRI